MVGETDAVGLEEAMTGPLLIGIGCIGLWVAGFFAGQTWEIHHLKRPTVIADNHNHIIEVDFADGTVVTGASWEDKGK